MTQLYLRYICLDGVASLGHSPGLTDNAIFRLRHFNL